MREFGTDSARSDHNHAFRLFRQRHRLTVADNLDPVLGQVGKHLAAGARSQDDMLGREILLAPVLVHLHAHGLVRLQAGFSGNDFHLVFVQQELHSFGHRFGHAPAAGYNRLEIRLHFAFDAQAVISRMFGILVNLGAFEQGFGRDAAPIEADSA